MKPEFYKDMEQRIHAISLTGEFFSLLYSKVLTLKSYGFQDIDSMILFIFFVLRFIMERSLQDSICTMDDIALAILEINHDTFRLRLDQEQARKLAVLIINDIFCNSGEPVVFDPLPGEPQWKQYPSFISSEVIYQDNQRVITYKMSNDGFQLLLSTLEMEENMRIKFSDLIVDMRLKARDYAGALEEIKNSFQLLKIRQFAIEEKILQVRSNALSITNDEYHKQLEETGKLMSETRDKFQIHQKNVQAQIDELSSRGEDNTLDPKEVENLTTLHDIEQMLGATILTFTNILTILNDFRREYSKQLTLQLRSVNRRRYSIKPLIYDRVLENPDLLGYMDLFIHPLLLKEPDKIFQLDHAFAYRKILDREGDEEEEQLEYGVDEEAARKEKEAIQKKLAQFDEALYLLMEAVLKAPGRSLTLQQFQDQLSEEDRARFFPTLDHARELLTSWSAIAEHDIQDLYAQGQEMVYEDVTSYNFFMSLYEAMRQLPGLQKWQKLCIDKADGQVSFAFEENGLHLQVSVDNLRFALKGELYG